MKYTLSYIAGFNDVVKTNEVNKEYEKYYSVKEYVTKGTESYSIVRYNKELLSKDIVPTYGLLRSVIISKGRVVSFAPPKSISVETFMNDYPLKMDNIVAEEFVEGTMINVFFDPNYGVAGCWQIATRNTVGADVAFNQGKKTFYTMFMEACQENNLFLNSLNPAFCYSFVLQHPENRIVVPFKNPQLYLVSVYEIVHGDNIRVCEHDMRIVSQDVIWGTTGVKFPEKYEFSTYTQLIDKFASPNTPYNILGVVVRNMETGDRTKIRNPSYEEVRHLKGNQSKLQYQYLCLRQNGKLPEFLKFYPELKPEMSKFREQVHLFTNTLFKNYISCYIKKENPLREFPEQYRTHMFKIHEQYINDLKPNNLFVTNTIVIKYVNELPSSLLMYCLNYNMRKRAVDTIKTELTHLNLW
jgi:hypothetical protein